MPHRLCKEIKSSLCLQRVPRDHRDRRHPLPRARRLQHQDLLQAQGVVQAREAQVREKSCFHVAVQVLDLPNFLMNLSDTTTPILSVVGDEEYMRT